MHYMICYDLEQDRNRQCVFNLLRDFGGVATQLSLFICELTPAEKQQLLTAVTPLLDPDSDRFFIYPVCQHCLAGSRRSGEQQPVYQSNPVKVI